jgi:hypothetical protein
VQLAAYANMAEASMGAKMDRLIGVRLKPDGGYDIKNYTTQRKTNWAAFLSALNIHRWKQANKIV